MKSRSILVPACSAIMLVYAGRAAAQRERPDSREQRERPDSREQEATVVPAGPASRKTPPPELAPTGVWDRHFALMGVLGFGTPSGFAGISIEASPRRNFVFAASVGTSEHVQTAAMMRVRFPMAEHLAMSLGAGASMGAYERSEGGVFTINVDPPKAHWKSSNAFWFDGDVSLEHAWDSGFQMREFLGYAVMMNPGSLDCSGVARDLQHCLIDHAGSTEGTSVFYLGVALGYGF